MDAKGVLDGIEFGDDVTKDAAAWAWWLALPDWWAASRKEQLVRANVGAMLQDRGQCDLFDSLADACSFFVGQDAIDADDTLQTRIQAAARLAAASDGPDFTSQPSLFALSQRRLCRVVFAWKLDMKTVRDQLEHASQILACLLTQKTDSSSSTSADDSQSPASKRVLLPLLGRVIFVTRTGKLTAPHEADLRRRAALPWEHFESGRFHLRLMDHDLLHRHRPYVMSKEQAEARIALDRAKPRDYPGLMRSDPVARHFGLTGGALVLFRRFNAYTGAYPYVRRVH